MDYATLINRLLKKFHRLHYGEIEAGIIREILNTNSLVKIRNSLVQRRLDAESVGSESVVRWLRDSKITADLRLLEKFYELHIDEKERKVNGAYYTPEYVVSHIIRETTQGSVGTIFDPACGSGAFLTEATRFLRAKTKLSFAEIYSRFIFGADILPSNKSHTEVVLALLAITNGEDSENYHFNIFTGDSLGFNWGPVKKLTGGFDFIVGNPPYVRTKNLSSEVRGQVSKWSTGRFGNPDLYIPFFELGVSLLKEGGRLGYITPNTYLTSVNAQSLRAYLSREKLVEKIIDFNGWQIFKGATTYTCVSIISKRPNREILFTLVDKKEKLSQLQDLEYTRISSEKLNEEEWRLLSKNDAENIFRIENSGSPLYKYVNRFVTGIATLQNDLFLIEDNEANLLQKVHGGRVFWIERAFTKKIIKPNKIKNTISLRNNRERVIYPYEVKEGKAVLMGEDYISQNFPGAYEYLLEIKPRLSLRDKGKKNHQGWYAYGRSQGVADFGKKIILPMMGNRPSFIVVEDPDSLIYCGYALFVKKEEDYQLLEKILNSKVMWYYIKKTSKNYSGGFKSFAKNYVKNFSIPEFQKREKEKLLSLQDSAAVDSFLWSKYQLSA